MIRIKVEAVNAMIKLKYMDHPQVMVCHHDNLRKRKFKKNDLLHLTDMGTSRLANNLKYKIAEALKIEVVKRRRREFISNRNNAETYRHNFNNSFGVYDNRDRYEYNYFGGNGPSGYG